MYKYSIEDLESIKRLIEYTNWWQSKFGGNITQQLFIKNALEYYKDTLEIINNELKKNNK